VKVTDPPVGAVVKTFLIADVRGYTRFTQVRGDEHAGRLAGKFADLVEAVVPLWQGHLLELRGDEALVVFDSPRQAIRAAIALQERFVAETLADPTLPLGVGIGVDSGEAVPVQGGYRGGALNLAARLCSLATAGQILASAEVVHLARRIDGVRYESRGPVQFKGIDDAPSVMSVAPEGSNPAQDPEFLRITRPPQAPTSRRRVRARLVVPIVVVAVIAAAGIVIALHTSGSQAPPPTLSGSAVGRISIASGRLSGQLPVGSGPGAVAAGDGAVWVANATDGTVTRINSSTPAAQSNTIPLTQPLGGSARPSAIAVGDGAVWVTDVSDQTLDRIDPSTNRVAATIAVGNGPSAVAVVGHDIWVANSLDDTVNVVDGGDDRVVATVPVGAQPSALAYGDGAIWVADTESADVVRIDPSSRQPTASIGVGSGPSAVVAGGSGVWVANSLAGTVSRVDPTTNQVTSTQTVGSMPNALVLSGGDLWIADGNGDDVSRIDTKQPSTLTRVPVGSATAGVAAVEGSIWVSAAGSPAQHSGGSLSIIASSDYLGGINNSTTLDPAFAYRNFGWDLISVMNDGLVAFRRAAAAAGTQIVPDLATALPQVSDGGRAYTFTLRSGIDYSNGGTVVPSDVLASFERMVPTGPDYFAAIAGASACEAHPKRECNLSSGITVDDADDTVTFNLVKPDPDFLFKMALPFADVLPKATEGTDQGLRSHPATGPYVLTSSRGLTDGRRQITLSRNPHFKVFSASAQPAGYPNAITLTVVPAGSDNSAADVDQVIAGKYDWTPDSAGQSQLTRLATVHGSQLHSYLPPEADFYFLNVKVAPFTDVRVRRAVNLAVDRSAFIKTLGGPLNARPTCQLLPPTMTGYRPYCPYTSHPDAAGGWESADVAKAKALIRRAGAVGDHVRLARWVQPSQDRVLIKALREIGLVPRLVRPPGKGDAQGPDFYEYILDPHHHVGIGNDGWYADYPEPSNMVVPQFICGADANPSQFCDPSVDQLTDVALRTQVSNPANAPTAWHSVDRAIVDAAPAVFLANPRAFDILSARIGNYQNSPEWGALIDQLWISRP
jgi:peptide/nickel transport system substrate-binding protein